MAKLKFARNYGNYYEMARDTLSRLPIYGALGGDNTWSNLVKAGRDDLDMYIGAMSNVVNKGLDLDQFIKDYKLEYLSDENKLDALYNEAFADRTEVKKHKENVYDSLGNIVGTEDVEATDYDYYKKLISYNGEVGYQTHVMNELQKRKDEMSWFQKRINNLAGIAVSAGEGFVTGINAMAMSASGIFDYIATLSSGGSQEEALDAFVKGAATGGVKEYEDFIRMAAQWEMENTTGRKLDGTYATGISGRLMAAVQSSARQLPSFIVSQGLGALGAAPAVAGAIGSSMFYAGSHAERVSETYNMYKDSGASVSTLEIMSNATLKTVTEFAIEQILGEVWGATTADIRRGTFAAGKGMAKKGIGKSFVKEAVKRRVKDSFQEGIEEVLQDASTWAIDKTIFAYNQNFYNDAEISVESLWDSFIVAAISSAMSSGAYSSIDSIANIARFKKGSDKAITIDKVVKTKKEVDGKKQEVTEKVRKPLWGLKLEGYSSVMEEVNNAYLELQDTFSLFEEDINGDCWVRTPKSDADYHHSSARQLSAEEYAKVKEQYARGMMALYQGTVLMSSVANGIGEEAFKGAVKLMEQVASYERDGVFNQENYIKWSQELMGKLLEIDHNKRPEVVSKVYMAKELEKLIKDNEVGEIVETVNRDDYDKLSRSESTSKSTLFDNTLPTINNIVQVKNAKHAFVYNDTLVKPIKMSNEMAMNSASETELVQNILTELNKSSNIITNRAKFIFEYIQSSWNTITGEDISSQGDLLRLAMFNREIYCKLLSNQDTEQFALGLYKYLKSHQEHKEDAFSNIDKCINNMENSMILYYGNTRSTTYEQSSYIPDDVKDKIRNAKAKIQTILSDLLEEESDGALSAYNTLTWLQQQRLNTVIDTLFTKEIAKEYKEVIDDNKYVHKIVSEINKKFESTDDRGLALYGSSYYLDHRFPGNNLFNMWLDESGLNLTNWLDANSLTEQDKANGTNALNILRYRQTQFMRYSNNRFYVMYDYTNKTTVVKASEEYDAVKDTGEVKFPYRRNKSRTSDADIANQYQLEKIAPMEYLFQLGYVTDKLSDFEKSYITIGDVLRKPDMYMDEKVYADYDAYCKRYNLPMSERNAYKFVSESLIDTTDGTLSLCIRPDGDYSLAKMTNYKSLFKDVSEVVPEEPSEMDKLTATEILTKMAPYFVNEKYADDFKNNKVTINDAFQNHDILSTDTLSEYYYYYTLREEFFSYKGKSLTSEEIDTAFYKFLSDYIPAITDMLVSIRIDENGKYELVKNIKSRGLEDFIKQRLQNNEPIKFSEIFNEKFIPGELKDYVILPSDESNCDGYFTGYKRTSQSALGIGKSEKNNLKVKDNAIYIGTDIADGYSDKVFLFTVAHEFTHALQHYYGLNSGTNDDLISVYFTKNPDLLDNLLTNEPEFRDSVLQLIKSASVLKPFVNYDGKTITIADRTLPEIMKDKDSEFYMDVLYALSLAVYYMTGEFQANGLRMYKGGSFYPFKVTPFELVTPSGKVYKGPYALEKYDMLSKYPDLSRSIAVKRSDIFNVSRNFTTYELGNKYSDYIGEDKPTDYTVSEDYNADEATPQTARAEMFKKYGKQGDTPASFACKYFLCAAFVAEGEKLDVNENNKIYFNITDERDIINIMSEVKGNGKLVTFISLPGRAEKFVPASEAFDTDVIYGKLTNILEDNVNTYIIERGPDVDVEGVTPMLEIYNEKTPQIRYVPGEDGERLGKRMTISSAEVTKVGTDKYIVKNFSDLLQTTDYQTSDKHVKELEEQNPELKGANAQLTAILNKNDVYKNLYLDNTYYSNNLDTISDDDKYYSKIQLLMDLGIDNDVEGYEDTQLTVIFTQMRPNAYSTAYIGKYYGDVYNDFVKEMQDSISVDGQPIYVGHIAVKDVQLYNSNKGLGVISPLDTTDLKKFNLNKDLSVTNNFGENVVPVGVGEYQYRDIKSGVTKYTSATREEVGVDEEGRPIVKRRYKYAKHTSVTITEADMDLPYFKGWVTDVVITDHNGDKQVVRQPKYGPTMSSYLKTFLYNAPMYEKDIPRDISKKILNGTLTTKDLRSYITDTDYDKMNDNMVKLIAKSLYNNSYIDSVEKLKTYAGMMNSGHLADLFAQHQLIGKLRNQFPKDFTDILGTYGSSIEDVSYFLYNTKITSVDDITALNMTINNIYKAALSAALADDVHIRKTDMDRVSSILDASRIRYEETVVDSPDDLKRSVVLNWLDSNESAKFIGMALAMKNNANLAKRKGVSLDAPTVTKDGGKGDMGQAISKADDDDDVEGDIGMSYGMSIGTKDMPAKILDAYFYSRYEVPCARYMPESYFANKGEFGKNLKSYSLYNLFDLLETINKKLDNTTEVSKVLKIEKQKKTVITTINDIKNKLLSDFKNDAPSTKKFKLDYETSSDEEIENFESLILRYLSTADDMTLAKLHYLSSAIELGQDKEKARAIYNQQATRYQVKTRNKLTTISKQLDLALHEKYRKSQSPNIENTKFKQAIIGFNEVYGDSFKDLGISKIDIFDVEASMKEHKLVLSTVNDVKLNSTHNSIEFLSTLDNVLSKIKDDVVTGTYNEKAQKSKALKIKAAEKRQREKLREVYEKTRQLVKLNQKIDKQVEKGKMTEHEAVVEKGKNVDFVDLGSIAPAEVKGIPQSISKFLRDDKYDKFAKTEVQNIAEDEDVHVVESFGEFIDTFKNKLNAMTTDDWHEFIDFYTSKTSAVAGTPEAINKVNNLMFRLGLVALHKVNVGEIELSLVRMEELKNKLKNTGTFAGQILNTLSKTRYFIDPQSVIQDNCKSILGIDVSDTTVNEFTQAMRDAYRAGNDAEANDRAKRRFDKALKDLKQEAIEKYKEQGKSKGNLWFKLLEFQRTMMLSGPGTWLRNYSSNFIIGGIKREDGTTVVPGLNSVSEAIGNKFVKGLQTLANKVFPSTQMLEEHGQYKMVGTKVTDEVKNWIKSSIIDTDLYGLVSDKLGKYDPRKMVKYDSKNDGASSLADLIALATISKVKYHTEYSLADLRAELKKKDSKFINNVKKDAGAFYDYYKAFVARRLSDDYFVKRDFIRNLGKMLTEDIENSEKLAKKLEGKTKVEQLEIVGKLQNNKGTEFRKALFEDGLNNGYVMETVANAFLQAQNDYMRKNNIIFDFERKLMNKPAVYFMYKQVFPFAGSAWNWFMAGLKYNPIGLAKTIVNFAKMEDRIFELSEQRRKGEKLEIQPSMVYYNTMRDMGKHILGTFGWALGILLAASGAARIDEEDDKWKLWVGDTVAIDISRLFGTQGILLGIVFAGSIKDKTVNFEGLLNAVLDQMFNDSTITGLFDSFRYSSSVGDYLTNIPFNSMLMFIPNMLKMITATNKYRVMYEKGIIGKFEKVLVQLIPSVAYALPHYMDPYTGEKQVKDKAWFLVNMFNKLSPVDVSAYNVSDMEKEAISLGVTKGELSCNYKINDEKVKLNATLREATNKFYGELNKKDLAELKAGKKVYAVTDDKGKRVYLTYNKMTDMQKASVINRIMNENAGYAKIYILTDSGKYKYYATDSEYQELRKLGITKNVYRQTGKTNGFVKLS